MKPSHALALAVFGSTVVAAPGAFAQSPDDRFYLRLSAFNANANLGVHANGRITDGQESASFEDGISGDIGSDWRLRGAAGLRLTPRQYLVANFFDYRRSQSWNWDGGTIDPNSFFDQVDLDYDPVEVPEAGVDGMFRFSLASLNYDFALVQTETFEWGVGLGLSYARIEATADARATGTDDVDAQSVSYTWQRNEWSPGAHTRVHWAPAERWRVGLEGQYLSTDWGDFLSERGHFERAGVFVEYLVTERIGIHAGYDWFRLKLTDDYRGSFGSLDEAGIERFEYDGSITGDLRVHGPMLGVTFHF